MILTFIGHLPLRLAFEIPLGLDGEAEGYRLRVVVLRFDEAKIGGVVHLICFPPRRYEELADANADPRQDAPRAPEANGEGWGRCRGVEPLPSIEPVGVTYIPTAPVTRESWL